MFSTDHGPRLFGLAPGIDFARELVAGLRARMEGQPPEAMARVELIVNTGRMRRRIEEAFAEGPPGFLPRMRLLDAPVDPVAEADLPAPVSPLRRRLELTRLVSGLLEAQPDLAPKAALFDLADSLAALMDEMQIEGVPPEALSRLDVSDMSGHWARALRFLTIVQGYFDADSAPDAACLQRRIVDARIAAWQAAPPDHPVVVAGSTGSRGTTLRLMAAVARLPQGAVVLPGFDTDMPRHVWDQLLDAERRTDRTQPGEDHPQYRFARLLDALGAAPQDVMRWTDATPPAPARNRLVSLALRPAPVTDQWLEEGPSLGPMAEATDRVTLVEAATRREEAMAIALRLRQAAEDGVRAALVTPDRQLSRMVTAALDRWEIVPDDSAGVPGHLSPPGRLLRHVAALYPVPLSAEALIEVLRHPLTHRGDDTARHGLWRQELDLFLRGTRRPEGAPPGPHPFPDAEVLRAWGVAVGAEAWAGWIVDTFCQPPVGGLRPLEDWVADHVARTEAVVAGTAADDPSELWAEEAGRTLRAAVDALAREADAGAPLDARTYSELFTGILQRAEVRRTEDAHPLIRIWGTLEARAMGADLMILGGLNDGSWPEIPAADPWLNRRMRADTGLLLPERRIGLSAHDFQQAVAGSEAWLTRAQTADEAETVPSRWVNRLANLMRGLGAQGGPEALEAMQARGARWLDMARALEEPIATRPAPRPSPVPPVDARPKKLSVTRIKTLLRDPYAIYAQSVLRLRPLDPLQRPPDALLRGIALHGVVERFVSETVDTPEALTPERLMAVAEAGLAEVPFPAIRRLWAARLARVSRGFVTDEAERRRRAQPHPDRLEVKGRVDLQGQPFTLTGTADRIDIDERGGAWVYDYKTGAPPTQKQERHFDKQLLLEAAMLMRGAFPDLAPRHVAGLVYIGLGSKAGEAALDLDEVSPEQIWDEFARLIAAMRAEDHGFTARRAMEEDSHGGDYDHLSRLGEWEVTDTPETERVE
jgi:double-strand break repair protein AddB